MYTPDPLIKRVELNTGDENEYPQDTRSVQPVQGKPAKDFKKVLSKSHKDHKEELKTAKRQSPAKMFKDDSQQPKSEEIGDEEIGLLPKKEDEENAGDVASFSLFDLSKKAAQPKEKGMGFEKSPNEEIAKVQSPSDLFKTAAKEPKKAKFEHAETPVFVNKDVEEPSKEKFTTKYTQEQPDLSYVNPLATANVAQNAVVTKESAIQGATPLTPAMKDLIEQVVKQMYTVSQTDKTDTVMTLQHPPLFHDARLIVTAYDTARGQYNITFENLTQAAQRILDLEENRRSLLNALEHKGYNVQMFTTTTVMEQRMAVEEPYAQQGKQEERDQGQGENPRKRKRDQDTA